VAATLVQKPWATATTAPRDYEVQRGFETMKASKIATQQKDPLEQFLAETALSIAHDGRGRPIRLNTAQQRQLAAPFHVTLMGEFGEGVICRFVLDANGKASGWCWFKERLHGGQVEWPVRMYLVAVDGETVRAIVRERGGILIESRFIPAPHPGTATVDGEEVFLR
jgi:hypothetical protein